MIKIAFVGQQEYFNCVYGNALDDLYEVHKFQMIWGGPWYYYSELVEIQPDVTFFFRPELYPQELLHRLSGVKVALSSEPLPYHLNGKLHSHSDTEYRWNSLKAARGRYDHFYHFNELSIQFLRNKGMHVDGAFVFPVDTDLYRPRQNFEKWDAIFFGRSTPHREHLLAELKRDYRLLHIAHGVVDDDLVDIITSSRIGINIHVDEYLTWEHRVQNMMACGVLVMSEPLVPNEVFIPGYHYVEFSSKQELWERFTYYKVNRAEGAIIARNGMNRTRLRLSARKELTRLIEEILSPARPT